MILMIYEKFLEEELNDEEISPETLEELSNNKGDEE